MIKVIYTIKVQERIVDAKTAAIGAPLAVAGARQLPDFQLHRPLGDKTNRLTIGVRYWRKTGTNAGIGRCGFVSERVPLPGSAPAHRLKMAAALLPPPWAMLVVAGGATTPRPLAHGSCNCQICY